MQLPIQQLRTHLRTTDPASDAELVRRYAHEQDRVAFETLLHRHGRLVVGVCQRIVGQAADAEDAAQAVFLTLAQKASQIRQPERLTSWLFQVAVRVSRRAKRRRSRLSKRCPYHARESSPKSKPVIGWSIKNSHHS